MCVGRLGLMERRPSNNKEPERRKHEMPHSMMP
jgi:hypothetical protein